MRQRGGAPLTHKTLNEVAAVPAPGTVRPDGPEYGVGRQDGSERDDSTGQGGRLAFMTNRRSLRRGRGSPARRRRNLKAYLFVSPAMVLFLAFIAIPVAGIVVFSFLQWDLLTPPKFAGVSNFRMLAHDPELGQALFNSLLFDVMTTTLHIIVGMTLAIAVTSVTSRTVRYWAADGFRSPVPDVCGRGGGHVELYPLGQHRATQLLPRTARYEPAGLVGIRHLGSAEPGWRRPVADGWDHVHHLPGRAANHPVGPL